MRELRAEQGAVVNTFRRSQAVESGLIPCHARRWPHGKLRCEMAALHMYGYPLLSGFHAARDRAGRWHFWGNP
jgi:hypothetical protein